MFQPRRINAPASREGDPSNHPTSRKAQKLPSSCQVPSAGRSLPAQFCPRLLHSHCLRALGRHHHHSYVATAVHIQELAEAWPQLQQSAPTPLQLQPLLLGDTPSTAAPAAATATPAAPTSTSAPAAPTSTTAAAAPTSVSAAITSASAAPASTSAANTTTPSASTSTSASSLSPAAAAAAAAAAFAAGPAAGPAAASAAWLPAADNSACGAAGLDPDLWETIHASSSRADSSLDELDPSTKALLQSLDAHTPPTHHHASTTSLPTHPPPTHPPPHPPTYPPTHPPTHPLHEAGAAGRTAGSRGRSKSKWAQPAGAAGAAAAADVVGRELLSLTGRPRAVGLSPDAAVAAHQLLKNGRRAPSPSPDQVAMLARVFRLSEERAHSVAVSRPSLLLHSEQQVLQRAQEVAALLQIKEPQALLAIRKQPFLLEVALEVLQERLAALQQQLGLDSTLTCGLVANAPSVLKRPADKLGERFERLAQSLAMTKEQVVHMSGRCSHTQFLTERSRKLAVRFQALADTLHLAPEQAAKVVRRQPDVLFMSSRILANKVKVLQAVFGATHAMVTPLVAKCPEVLRRDMNSVRRIVCMLQVMLNVAPDYVYRMMAHNARLLSQPFQSTQWKAQRLRAAASSSLCWGAQWRRMQPKHMEHCLSATQTTYSRLDYIMQTGQQEQVKLVDALRMPQAKFEGAFPDYASWRQQQQVRQQLAVAVVVGASC